MAGVQDLIKKGSPQPPQKFVVMGDPFTGKTTLAAKAPKPLFISTDGNAAKAGLDAIDADTLGTVREAINYFIDSSEYETLVIDTVEGIADLFEKRVIADYNRSSPSKVTALQDVPFGGLTGKFNKLMAQFSDTLWKIPKNVIILTYTKRQTDDVTGSIILASELKAIRHFTKLSDGLILTSFDGDKHRAQVVSKRTVMAGKVEYGDIEPFLRAAGWELPTRKVKLGTTKK